MLCSTIDMKNGNIGAHLWAMDAYKGIENALMTENFPCTFGTKGHKSNLHKYSLLSKPYSSKELSEDIRTYLNDLENKTPNISGLTGLLVLFENPETNDLQQLQNIAWAILIGATENENCNQINPPTPSSSDYVFELNGEKWFINFSSSIFNERKSRNLGHKIVLAMQPLSASDAYFKFSNKVKGQAQRMVRARAEIFDGCPLHPGLGGVIGSEDKMSPLKLSYFLPDTNDEPSYEPWLDQE